MTDERRDQMDEKPAASGRDGGADMVDELIERVTAQADRVVIQESPTVIRKSPRFRLFGMRIREAARVLRS